MPSHGKSQRRDYAPTWLTYFLKFPYALLAHEAYLTLPPSAQIILIDFKRHYDRLTEFGLHDEPKTGIPYSYGHCIIDCHRHTFRRSMERLEERGFLIPTGQRDQTGEVDYYLQSSNWRAWKAPEKDHKRIQKLKARILRREALDTSPDCTFFVRPHVPLNANPLLNFWTQHPAYMDKKRTALPIRSEIEISECASAPGTQEMSQQERAELDYQAEVNARRIHHHNFRDAE